MAGGEVWGHAGGLGMGGNGGLWALCARARRRHRGAHRRCPSPPGDKCPTPLAATPHPPTYEPPNSRHLTDTTQCTWLLQPGGCQVGGRGLGFRGFRV